MIHIFVRYLYVNWDRYRWQPDQPSTSSKLAVHARKKRPLKARFLYKIADSRIYSLSLALSLSHRRKDCLKGEEELRKNENGSSLEPADKL
jgi:hypothetical protein